MNELKKIQSNAQILIAKKDTKSVLEYLRTHLEKVDSYLHNQALLLESRRNLILNDNQEKLISKEQFTIEQNKLQRALGEFINDLDNPNRKEVIEKGLSNQQLLMMILFVLVLILIGIGVLIYLRIN